jgi:hypothetical protein
MRAPERIMRTKYYLAAATTLLALQVAVLYGFGQPFLSASGRILLWVNDPLSPETSQQLADWYSFSHLIHGMILFWLLRWLAPGWPLPARLLAAMGIEIAWEITENSPPVIAEYRKQATAAGYVGDSILNSLSDTAMMACGFWLASRLGGRTVFGVAVALEIFTAVMIRDNLSLNVINLIAPSGWASIRFIHDWQAAHVRTPSATVSP